MWEAPPTDSPGVAGYLLHCGFLCQNGELTPARAQLIPRWKTTRDRPRGSALVGDLRAGPSRDGRAYLKPTLAYANHARVWFGTASGLAEPSGRPLTAADYEFVWQPDR